MSSLLIVTSSYPFGMGESFFAPELEALAKRFDRVTILPTTSRSCAMRPVPKNVRVLEPLLTSRWRDIQNAISAPADAFLAAKELLGSGISALDIANAMRLRTALSHRLNALILDGYDLVYLYWGFPLTTLVPAFRFAPLCVQRFHGSDLWCSNGGQSLRAGVTDHMQRIDKLLFVSEKGRDIVRQALPDCFRERLQVRYLGSTDFGPVPCLPYANGLSIISCTFITENKRLDRISKVVRRLSRSLPVTWTHIGGGDDTATAKLREMAGHDAKTEFLGSIPHDRIAGIFHAHRPNILMSMSNSEGLAINVLEAMSADVPIISTDVGGMAEAVTDRVGILVRKGHFDMTDALADRVLLEIEPGGLLAEASPRSVWEDRFDARANAILLADELRAMCDAKSLV